MRCASSAPRARRTLIGRKRCRRRALPVRSARPPAVPFDHEPPAGTVTTTGDVRARDRSRRRARPRPCRTPSSGRRRAPNAVRAAVRSSTAATCTLVPPGKRDRLKPRSKHVQVEPPTSSRENDDVRITQVDGERRRRVTSSTACDDLRRIGIVARTRYPAPARRLRCAPCRRLSKVDASPSPASSSQRAAQRMPFPHISGLAAVGIEVRIATPPAGDARWRSDRRLRCRRAGRRPGARTPRASSTFALARSTTTKSLRAPCIFVSATRELTVRLFLPALSRPPGRDRRDRVFVN